MSHNAELRIGLIGKGFVGSAVANGFDRNVKQFVVDPKINEHTLEELVRDFDPPLLFICVPTPKQESYFDVDPSTVRQTLKHLTTLLYKGVVVVKSTITPGHLIKIKKDFKKLKIVYNPEFLTEANSFNDFLNPNMQILGGAWRDCETVEKAYIRHSSVKTVPTFKTDLITASLLKYTINSWLATKVTFFNELYTLHQASGTKLPWEMFTDMVSRDPRIGDTHMKVPGLDGQFGFGGHCFPKDTKALLYYSKSIGAELTLLKKIIELNEEQCEKN